MIFQKVYNVNILTCLFGYAFSGSGVADPLWDSPYVGELRLCVISSVSEIAAESADFCDAKYLNDIDDNDLDLGVIAWGEASFINVSRKLDSSDLLWAEAQAYFKRLVWVDPESLKEQEIGGSPVVIVFPDKEPENLAWTITFSSSVKIHISKKVFDDVYQVIPGRKVAIVDDVDLLRWLMKTPEYKAFFSDAVEGRK